MEKIKIWWGSLLGRDFSCTKATKIQCVEYLNHLHFKCCGIDNKLYEEVSSEKKIFTCRFCTNYSCLNCSQERIQDDGCDLWIHTECAKVTKKSIMNYYIPVLLIQGSVTLVRKICSFFFFLISNSQHVSRMFSNVKRNEVRTAK